MNDIDCQEYLYQEYLYYDCYECEWTGSEFDCFDCFKEDAYERCGQGANFQTDG